MKNVTIGSLKKNNEGFVLVLTLLCALILSSIMLSTMFVSTKGQKLSKNFKESVQTLNAADAAVKQAKGAINSWLATQQTGTGVIANFTAILVASQAAGKLVVPGNATNFGNVSMFGNTIVITATNNDNTAIGESSSSTTDTDRIIVLQGEATSATRQRVRIRVYIQAPSDTNTTGTPSLLAASTFCNDTLGRKQKLRVLNGSVLDSNDHSLPAFNCIGAACIMSTTSPSDPDNLPLGIMFNAAIQTMQVNGGSTVAGTPASLVTAADGTNCDQWTAFASQVSSLNNSLPNVNVVDSQVVTSAMLGTRTQPKIAIINGATRVTNHGNIIRSTAEIQTNAKGSGIMLVQYDSQTFTRTAAATQKNFYYEGLVIMYGDEWATFRLKGEDMVYGGVVMLSGSDDTTLLERFAVRNSSNMFYSKAATDQANLALGSIGISYPVTDVTDSRNSTVTIGWYEDYNF